MRNPVVIHFTIANTLNNMWSPVVINCAIANRLNISNTAIKTSTIARKLNVWNTAIITCTILTDLILEDHSPKFV